MVLEDMDKGKQGLTVRVYGFLIDEKNNLLVSDEIIQGKYFTKLPGGGLEIGEGTRDCLAREFMEEANIHVTIGKHVYTTDYYQPSLFGNAKQFMGIYYLVHSTEMGRIKTVSKPFDFTATQIAQNNDTESFRWVPLAETTVDIFSLPTDKIALKLLKEMILG